VVNNADIGFVEYLVTSRDFIQRARKYEQGTVYERMAVSPQDLAKIKVRMPVIEEQQKIANFLTALDEKITAEKSKLTAAKKFKKALLQRMFV
jgi:type I restriction enzyme S subunit